MPEPTLYCGFCGKADYEVRLLLGGPQGLICDNCADLCIGIQIDRFGLINYLKKLLTTEPIPELGNLKVPSLWLLGVAVKALWSRGPYNGVDVLKAVINDLQALLDKQEASRVKSLADDSPLGESP